MKADGSNRPFAVACAILGFALATAIMFMGPAVRTTGTLDSDGWFLLASGREIVTRGIPNVNPWSLVGGQGVILQQWLHDVWLYLWYSNSGYGGVAVSVAIPATLAAAAYLRLVRRLTGESRYPWAPLLIGSAGFLLMSTFISVRPSLWTAAILFATMSVCLDWKWRVSPSRRLILLPMLSILSVNLQAALWPLPVAAAAAFLFPERNEISIGNLRGSLSAWLASRRDLVLAVSAMVVSTIANPYFLEGTLYLFRSLGAASYGDAIIELMPTWTNPASCAFLIIAVAGAVLSCIVAKRVPDTWLLVFWLVSLVVGASALRCLWIAWTLSFLVVAQTHGLMAGDRRANRCVPGAPGRAVLCTVLALSCAVSGLNSVRSGGSGFSAGWASVDNDMAWIVSSLGTHPGRIWSEDASLMNYLEWAGVPVTYDMRPEIWAEPIAGKGAADDYKAFVDQIKRGYRGIDGEGWAWAIVKGSNASKFEKLNRASAVATGRGFVLYRLG